MKVVKKYFKMALCFMAFALCSFFMVFAPTITAVAAQSVVAQEVSGLSTIKSKKIKSEVNASEGLLIPFATGVSDTYQIKVVDPSGYIHTAKLNSDNTFKQEEVDEQTVTYNGNGYFSIPEGGDGVKVSALTSGNYQVVYVLNKDGQDLYSNIYNVNVKNVSYELDFENTLIKNEVKTSTNASDRIELPIPTVKVVGDDNATANPLNPEKEIKVSYNGTSINLSEAGEETDYIEDNGKYYIQPSKAGIYKIQYTYKQGINRPTKTITIKVSDDFVAPTNFKVTTAPTISSFELGEKDITLPKLTAENEYNSNVDYKVESIKIEKESDSTIFQTLEAGLMTFDMTLEAFQGVNEATDSYDKLKGNYIITYSLVDAYGNKCTYTRRIENVTISSKPTIKMVYDYELDENKEPKTEPVSAETQLKNKYGYDQVILPAVYAEDAVSKNSELTVVRYLRNVNTSTLYYVDNLKYNTSTGELDPVESDEIGYNHSGDTNIGNINKSVKFQFSSDGSREADYAGTYQLEYKVIAKNITKRENSLTVSGSTKYTFTIVGSTTNEYEGTTPTVEITNLSNDLVVDRTETLNVKFTATDDDDTRLKNVVYYYYGDKTTESLKDNIKDFIQENYLDADRTQHALDNSTLIAGLQNEGYTGLTQAKLSEDGKGFDVAFDTTGDNKDASKATIVVVSYNDYGNLSIDTRKVTFKNINNDNNAPTVASFDCGGFNGNGIGLSDSNKAKEGETITLPTIVYNDEDNTLVTNVSYYVNSPESNSGLSYLSPMNFEVGSSKIVGGELTIDRSGKYVIIYSATDDAGNTTITYFTFEVVSDGPLTLEVNPVGDDLTTSSDDNGNTITAKKGAKISFDTIVRDSDNNLITADGVVKVKIENNGLSYTTSGDKELSYIFNGVGTYTLTFKAEYSEKESDAKVVYVEIEDIDLAWEGEFNVPEFADINSDIYLPDISTNKNEVVTVTVTPPTGSKLSEDVKKVFVDGDGNVGSFWYFKTNGTKGDYTVKYSAGSLTKTFTIKVGDNVPPTIKFEHKEELSKDLVYDGTNQIQIKFDVKTTGNVADRYFKITATSNGETLYSYDLGLSITDITDGSATPTSMSWTGLKWEITGDNVTQDSDDENLWLISGTGTYTIKLSIEDNNKNETVENITFKVVSEATAKENKDTVVGVVLIVISAVVLVGVILFFLFTGKKGGSNKSRKLVKSSKKQVEKTQKEEPVVEKVADAKVEETKEVEKVEEVKPVEETESVEKTEESVENVEETNSEEQTSEAQSTENSEAKEGEIEE